MKDRLLAKRKEYQEEYEKALEYANYVKAKVEVMDDIIFDLEEVEETQPVEEVQPTTL